MSIKRQKRLEYLLAFIQKLNIKTKREVREKIFEESRKKWGVNRQTAIDYAETIILQMNFD